ncbi:MAG: IS66 family transposase [Dehalococcoidia bacterium]
MAWSCGCGTEGRLGPSPTSRCNGAGLEERLGELLRERTLPNPDNQRLLEQLRWQHEWGHLLHFLEDVSVEPTNNRAERVLRPTVIVRKVSQCSKTNEGTNAFAVLVSVAPSARQSGQSVIRRLSHLRRPLPAHPPPLPP